MHKPSFLPYLAVRRPITILVTLLAILVIGVVAYQQIPLELLPSGFSPPFLGVWTPYRNASPREVEEQIARPIEEQVRTIPGVRRVNTYSSGNGCWTWLEFSPGTDMDVAYDLLRDRMERARAQLPDDVDRYFLRKFGRNDTPVIFLSISLPESVEDPYFIVDHYVKRPIERIDGVANIEMFGAFEKVLQIQVDQDKVQTYGINMLDLMNRLRNDNFALSSGWVYEGDKKFLVRSVARFKSFEEVKRIPINGYGITLGDIAQVKYDVPKRDWYQRINGKPAFKLEIHKESLANSVALTRKLRRIIQEDIRSQPQLAGAEINILFAEGDFIEESIQNLINTALWGGLFAIIILFFFLRQWQMTLIMMISIPLSVLIALIGMFFMGWTLNTVTMMGLMISVGMVVDNAIVVLENIYHRRHEGLPAKEASIWGASEVSLAVVMATLTTAVVFTPMLIIRDESGFFSFYLKRIGVPVIFALLGSLFVALVLIPLATTRLVSRGPTREWALISRAKSLYQKSLKFVLAHRLDTVLAILTLMLITFGYLMPHTKKVDSTSGNANDFRLIFDLPGNFSIQEANAFFKEVEDTIFAHAREYRVKAVDTGFRKQRGRVHVFLKNIGHNQWYHTLYYGLRRLVGLPAPQEMTREEIISDLKKRIRLKPGIEMRTTWGGPTEAGGEGSISIMLYGDDTGRLMELADEVKRRLRQIPGVFSVETDQESGNDEIQVFLDREKVARNGLNPNRVAFSIMYSLRGITLSRFQTRDKEIEIRIQTNEADRANLLQLKDLKFYTAGGRVLPLSAIARFNVERGLGEIPRENGKTFLAVKAYAQFKDLMAVSRQIDQVMKDFTMPHGYWWEKGRRFRRFTQQSANFQDAMIMAVVFVFLLMGILFESVMLPLSVLVSIPLSLFGAFLALWITDTPQDIMAGIGMIILVGVVVNNAIVLIDMINRRRREGFSREEAIYNAAANRFRPILMTSFTTIAGLIPMALGGAGIMGIPYAPMGRAIIGGMLTSTALTLLAVPVLYTLFDDLGLFFQQVHGWFRKSTIADQAGQSVQPE